MEKCMLCERPRGVLAWCFQLQSWRVRLVLLLCSCYSRTAQLLLRATVLQSLTTSLIKNTCTKLIKVFRITEKLQAGEFDRGLERNSAGQWPSRTVENTCAAVFGVLLKHCFPTLFQEAHQQYAFWMFLLSDPSVSGFGVSWS